MRDSTGELRPQTRIVVVLCYNILHACTYIAIWCVTTHDNKSHVAYDCTTHQTSALLATKHRFVKQIG